MSGENLKTGQITLLVPTMDRAEFVIRVLRYYQSLQFDGKIFIGDSSGEHDFQLTADFISSLKGDLRVEHRHYPGLNNYAVAQRLIQDVQTPYATFLPDDDFYVPTAIHQCIEFLDVHRDYSCAWGKSVMFVIDRLGPHGKLTALSPVNLATTSSLEQGSAEDRLFQHVGHYTSVFAGVCRTEMFRKALRNAQRLNETAEHKSDGWRTAMQFGELVSSFSMVVQGKSKALDCLYWIRQGHDQRHLFFDCLHWLTTPNWRMGYQIISQQVIEDMLESGMSQAQAEDVWNRIFAKHLVINLYTKHEKRYVEAQTMKVRLKSFITKYPALLRAAVGLRDLGRKVFGNPDTFDNITLPAVLNPQSRFYADFKPVNELVTPGDEEGKN